MNDTVKKYIPLVDFLECVLSKNSEVVLHDLTQPDSSVVDIRNGQISGRSIGAPATDLALKILHNNKSDKIVISNYTSHSTTGKPLRSASLLIKENDKCVGMLCVNTDLTIIQNLEEITAQISAIFGQASNSNTNTTESEKLVNSPSNLVSARIRELTGNKGYSVNNLTQLDRINIIRTLHNEGLFLLKGAVSNTAITMGVSEPTVYRYLQQVKKEMS